MFLSVQKVVTLEEIIICLVLFFLPVPLYCRLHD